MSEDWVYVGGTFDLFHPGHVRLLRQAKVYGSVVVSVNRDEFAERYKRKPIMTLEERMFMVSACRYTDMVVCNVGDEDSTFTIEVLQKSGVEVAYIIHGDDWQGTELRQQMGITEEWLRALQIAMVYAPYTSDISSTEIENRVRKRELVSC